MQPPLAHTPTERSDLVATLRHELEQQERPRLPRDAQPISTGALSLDRLLPWGGLRPGSLVEYLSAGEGQGAGAGAGTLALIAARAACHEGRALVVLDRQQQFYPPSAAAWGIDLSQTLLLRPANEAEEMWATDQALRCPRVGAVWVMCGPLQVRDFRRLQLAAEGGGTLGLLVRPAKVRGRFTWADVQWLVEPQPSRERWRLRVELVRCRGGTGGRSVQLEWNEETGTWCEESHFHATHLVHPLAELADPAAARRQTRA